MKPSKRIARRYFLDVRGSEDTPALAELIEPLAEFLEREGIDRLFAIETAAKDFFYGKTESRELENALRRLFP